MNRTGLPALQLFRCKVGFDSGEKSRKPFWLLAFKDGSETRFFVIRTKRPLLLRCSERPKLPEQVKNLVSSKQF